MEKDFIPYDRALRMKALGFDEPCLAFYNGKHLDLGVWDWEYPAGDKRRNIGQCPSAPTFSAAFRWFREKYKLHSVASFDKFIDEDNDVELDDPYFTYYYSINELWDNTKDYNKFVRGFMNVASSRDFMSQEEAELACLDKLIEIAESKSE